METFTQRNREHVAAILKHAEATGCPQIDLDWIRDDLPGIISQYAGDVTYTFIPLKARGNNASDPQ